MVNQELMKANEEQLMQLTDTAIPKYFRDSAMLAYESERQEPILQARSLAAYDATVQTMQVFIRTILMQDLMVNNLCSAEAVLYLPETDMKVSVSANMDSLLEAASQEQVKTAIGVFDAFTWNTIASLGFDKNPVKMFYRHLCDNLNFIKTKLELMDVDWQNVPVDGKLLDECHIQDVVSIHNMLHMFDGVESFVKEG